jgi:hypothetical protein
MMAQVITSFHAGLLKDSSLFLCRFPGLILLAMPFDELDQLLIREVNRVSRKTDALQLPGFHHPVQGCRADAETVSGFGGFQ